MYRTWTRVVVAGLLAAMPLWADSGADKPANEEKDRPETKAASAAAPIKEIAPPAGANFAAEIEQLRQMVLEQSRQLEAQRELMREQQSRLDALAAELRAAGDAAAPSGAQEPDREQDKSVLEGEVEAMADATNELQKKVAQMQTAAAASQRSTEGKLRALGNFSFSGDLRLRAETFTGNRPPLGTLTQDRFRGRYRLRFNVGARLTDELSGGLTVASGDANDPVSTNQSFSAFFTRKFFAIDRAFLSYKPKWFTSALRGNLDLTGGKYAYTWYRTPLTFDNDLNPEGVSQSLSWSFKDFPLERITLVGVQNFLAESGSGRDTTMFGGQVHLAWKLSDSIRVSTYGGFFDFRNADAVRAALNNVTVAGCTPQAPATSCTVPGTALGGNPNTNSASSSRYASRFGYVDTTFRVDIKTPFARFPVLAQFNFVSNTRACTNPGVVPTTPCNPRDREAYLAEISFGRLQERNDLQFGYGYFRIEREAVLAAFNESDLRQATNLAQNRVTVGWQSYRNVQLVATGWFGRQLVTAATPTKEDILRRLQFDLIYRF